MIILCVYMHRKDFRYFSSDLLIKFHKSRKYALLLVPLFISLFIFVSSQRSIAADGQDNSSFLKLLLNITEQVFSFLVVAFIGPE